MRLLVSFLSEFVKNLPHVDMKKRYMSLNLDHESKRSNLKRLSAFTGVLFHCGFTADRGKSCEMLPRRHLKRQRARRVLQLLFLLIATIFLTVMIVLNQMVHSIQASPVGHRMDESRLPIEVDRKHLFMKQRRGPESRNVSTKVYHYDRTEVPFVVMVYKRLDYLKEVIRSILVSDFPRHRVPLIISHDGHVPEMIDYVATLKTEFPFLMQLVHPFSCYDHPASFPGNDTVLNENYEGDAFGHLRSWVVTCCKHHFTWLLTSIFTKIHELDHVDSFLFSEEDYVVAPTIYEAIVNGLNAIEEFENGRSTEYFGLDVTVTFGNNRPVLERSDADAWRSSAFLSGPMTLNRRIFRKIQKHAATYCGMDGFDEYNWDWTIVHMQSLGYLPHTVLIPSADHPLMEHIGIQDGLHAHRVHNASTARALNVVFHGTRVYIENVNPPERKDQGFGGWGHPADKNHCMSLFEGSTSIS